MSADSRFETFTYSRRGPVELKLDVFRPEASSRRSAILIFHGGGWRSGAKEAVHPRAAALAARGFTGIAVQYRLLDVAPWPAPLEDAAEALSWVRAHADDLDIDRARVVAQGHSAGAHIALMTGTLRPEVRPAAAVAFYPPAGFYAAPPPPPADPGAPRGVTVIPVDELGRIPSWMVFGPEATDADLVAASPISLADATFPPAIFFHGAADSAIDPESSIALYRRLTELGVPSDLHIYAGRDHEFDLAPSMLAATVLATTSFLERTVTNRAELDDEAERFTLQRLIQAQAETSG